jgi:LmeA-like phospholipid-binding
MQKENSSPKNPQKIGIITNVLKTALSLWLRSQVSQISQLEVEIQASDRQLLSGRISGVSIFANHAIYQGLHLTQILLKAENIRINIGAVLKGQPLRLLETVPVVGEVILMEEDLKASLSSELLSTALNDLLLKLLPEHSQNSKPTAWQKISLANHNLVVSGIYTDVTNPTTIEMSLSLELLSPHELQLSQIQIKQGTAMLTEANQGHYLDLGSDVDIQELTLIPGKLVCRGGIKVNP